MHFPVSLVSSAAARAITGLSADQLHQQIESGQIRFAWNISSRGTSGRLPAWRLWLRELTAPSSVAKMSLREAVDFILGEQRARWRGVEIVQMLATSRPQIHRLHHAGALPGKIERGTLWISRAALVRFLLERSNFT